MEFISSLTDLELYIVVLVTLCLSPWIIEGLVVLVSVLFILLMLVFALIAAGAIALVAGSAQAFRWFHKR